MGSYEKEVRSRIAQGKGLPEKVDFSLLRFFWQASPFNRGKGNNIPRFLKEVTVLKNFTDNQLRILSNFLHLRKFKNDEIIFSQDEFGIGFYFIFSGNVGIEAIDREGGKEVSKFIISLEKYDYFGELALLQNNGLRTATATSRGDTEILGIFKPDLDSLMEDHPTVATKLLQSVSIILANRLTSITKEIKSYKLKIEELEKINDQNKESE